MKYRAEMWQDIETTNKNKILYWMSGFAHLAGHHTMETVWVERQRKAALFCRDTKEHKQQQGHGLRRNPILNYFLRV